MSNNQQKQHVKQAAGQAINRYTRKTWFVSLFLSIPFGYLVDRLLQDKIDNKQNTIITLAMMFAITFILMKVIRMWLYKKPSSSSWYIWLD